MLKLQIDELRDALEANDKVVVAEKVRRIEQSIDEGDSPGDEYLADIDAKLSQLLGDNPKALEVLRSSFDSNKSSAFLGLRLSSVLSKQGKTDEAVTVLKTALEANPADKRLHFALARHLARNGEIGDEAIYHLRNSFSRGDSRTEAQFWYARAEFLAGDRTNAHEVFNDLASAAIPSRLKRDPQGTLSRDAKRYAGTLEKKELTYGFVLRDGDRESLFTRPEWSSLEWRDLDVRQRVAFTLDFNYKGPIAVDLQLERPLRQQKLT